MANVFRQFFITLFTASVVFYADAVYAAGRLRSSEKQVEEKVEGQEAKRVLSLHQIRAALARTGQLREDRARYYLNGLQIHLNAFVSTFPRFEDMRYTRAYTRILVAFVENNRAHLVALNELSNEIFALITQKLLPVVIEDSSVQEKYREVVGILNFINEQMDVLDRNCRIFEGYDKPKRQRNNRAPLLEEVVVQAPLNNQAPLLEEEVVVRQGGCGGGDGSSDLLADNNVEHGAFDDQFDSQFDGQDLKHVEASVPLNNSLNNYRSSTQEQIDMLQGYSPEVIEKLRTTCWLISPNKKQLEVRANAIKKEIN